MSGRPRILDYLIRQCGLDNRWNQYLLLATSIYALIFLIVHLTTDNKEVEVFSVVGGFIGMSGSMTVIIAYILNPELRVPPLSLLFWRSVSDLGLALRFIIGPVFTQSVCDKSSLYPVTLTGNYDCDQDKCQLASVMLEFFLIASEAWFLCVTLDLLHSINDPFSTFQGRQKFYHLFSWSAASIFAGCTMFKAVYGFWYIGDNHEYHICWIRSSDDPKGSGSASTAISQVSSEYYGIDPHRQLSYSTAGDEFKWRPWVFLYFPILLVYVYSLTVIYLAYQRLKTGIPNTYIHRLRILIINSVNVIICLCYWAVAGSLVTATFFSESGTAKTLFTLIMYMISSKGFSSLTVWLLVNKAEVSLNSRFDSQRIDLNSALRQEVLLFATHGIRKSVYIDILKNEDAVKFRIPYSTRPNKDHEDSGTATTTMLSPLFFLSLLMGSERAIEQVRRNAENRSKKDNDIDSDENEHDHYDRFTMMEPKGDIKGSFYCDTETSMNISFQTTATDMHVHRISLDEATVSDQSAKGRKKNATLSKRSIFTRLCYSIGRFLGAPDDNVYFTEYSGYYFKKIRATYGITDSIYYTAFTRTIKERVNEGGASNAFFFYSDGEKFLAKSCSVVEIDVLRRNARKYVEYMCDNRDSLITKIYGIYRLQIYGISLYFFVMSNIFLNKENLMMHEKYDIKGSWVNRNAALPVNGEVVTCKHCNQKFVFQKKIVRGKFRNNSEQKSKKRNSTLSPLSSKAVSAVLDAALSTDSKNGSTVESRSTVNFDESGHSKSKILSFNTSIGNTDDDTFDADMENGDVTRKNKNLNKCPYVVGGHHEPKVTMKDNDLKFKLRLPKDIGNMIIIQSRKDADFLRDIGIMDYSLLLGVNRAEFDTGTTKGSEKVESVQDDSDKALDVERSSVIATDGMSDHGDDEATSIKENISDLDTSSSASTHVGILKKVTIASNVSERSQAKDITSQYQNIGYSPVMEVTKVMGPRAYIMGIVDFLQEWTLQKRLESWIKVNIYRKDLQGVSAVEPNAYHDRFVEKIEDIIDPIDG